MKIADQVRAACRWEATARKAGNVHPERDFADLTYQNFLDSAAAIAPILERQELPVGDMVLQAIQATRQVVRTNVNLGIVLLFAPLAKAKDVGRVDAVLEAMTVADSAGVFEAIRLANPGGLGDAPKQDVRETPTLPLREIMSLAKDRDLIARQYHNGYEEVLDTAAPQLLRNLDYYGTLERAIVALHLEIMSRWPDSLIARKWGNAAAERVRQGAGQVLEGGWDFADFDGWLIEQRYNPGTCADLVAASLFVALRQGKITLPSSIPWHAK